MTRSNNLSRWAGPVLATLVAALSLTVTARAVQTITTPRAAFVTYNLAAGAFSTPISLPPGQSVLVMGTCTTPGVQSVGQVTLHQFAAAGGLVWVGLDSPPGTAVISGFATGGGAHVVFLDQNNQVDIVTNGVSLQVRALNAARAGNVTLIW